MDGLALAVRRGDVDDGEARVHLQGRAGCRRGGLPGGICWVAGRSRRGLPQGRGARRSAKRSQAKGQENGREPTHGPVLRDLASETIRKRNATAPIARLRLIEV
jgi:hypothetical protein